MLNGTFLDRTNLSLGDNEVERAMNVSLELEDVVINTSFDPTSWIEMGLLASLLFVLLCSSFFRALRPGFRHGGFTWRDTNGHDIRMEPVRD